MKLLRRIAYQFDRTNSLEYRKKAVQTLVACNYFFTFSLESQKNINPFLKPLPQVLLKKPNNVMRVCKNVFGILELFR